ncbi:MAG: hypothetical protein ACYSUS_06575, partial [Planctomycetota bacterium]
YPRGDYNADIIANTAVYYLAARTADTASPVALNVSSPNIFELEVIAPNDTGQGDSNVIGYLQDSVEAEMGDPTISRYWCCGRIR